MSPLHYILNTPETWAGFYSHVELGDISSLAQVNKASFSCTRILLEQHKEWVEAIVRRTIDPLSLDELDLLWQSECKKSRRVFTRAILVSPRWPELNRDLNHDILDASPASTRVILDVQHNIATETLVEAFTVTLSPQVAEAILESGQIGTLKTVLALIFCPGDRTMDQRMLLLLTVVWYALFCALRAVSSKSSS